MTIFCNILKQLLAQWRGSDMRQEFNEKTKVRVFLAGKSKR
ncbi:hypothetical protein GGR08_001164 [Bartonella fuyuanensis]|uniref:Uncharacterized protein n=1 Tax=Bartonella fuyuanensis TaxID=1460968 RepID=A0A840DYW0_9HYPH|nr:hypothetical protein [Bartonella fuyuanensis]